jgi:hypothetical protein
LVKRIATSNSGFTGLHLGVYKQRQRQAVKRTNLDATSSTSTAEPKFTVLKSLKKFAWISDGCGSTPTGVALNHLKETRLIHRVAREVAELTKR